VNGHVHVCRMVMYGYHAKGNTGRRGGERGEAMLCVHLSFGSKWSQVGGGKKLHAHTPRPRASSEELLFVCLFVCLFACQLVGRGIEEK
jgi:hypothetical protein